MNVQLSALPDSKTTRIMLPYNRQYVIFAVYEVLDKNGAEYEKTDASTILNSTPFVRQYDILSNRWGDFICQKEYQTSDTHRSSKST